MDRTLKICLGLVGTLIILLIINDCSQPKPIDWSFNLGANDKRPFGMYIFNNEYAHFFKNQEADHFAETPYEFLDKNYDYNINDGEYDIEGNILIVSAYNDIDTESIEELLYFAKNGNDVFMSMTAFSKMLLDSLHIKIVEYDDFSKDSLITLTNNAFKKQQYQFDKGRSYGYFNLKPESNAMILGTMHNDPAKPNFIKCPYYGGNFYLHTEPGAFTNYNLLQPKLAQYTSHILSYINSKTIYWRTNEYVLDKKQQNPLRFILSNPPLKASWYILIFGFLLFILINVKRKQRIVPVILPFENSTVSFTKTISNLYLQDKNPHNIIDKKIIYFLERIRTEYHIDTTRIDHRFVQHLHNKTNKSITDIQQLADMINHHNKGFFEGIESDLIKMNNLMEKILN